MSNLYSEKCHFAGKSSETSLQASLVFSVENFKHGFIRQMAYCKTQKKCHEIQFSPGLFKLTLPE